MSLILFEAVTKEDKVLPVVPAEEVFSQPLAELEPLAIPFLVGNRVIDSIDLARTEEYRLQFDMQDLSLNEAYGSATGVIRRIISWGPVPEREMGLVDSRAIIIVLPALHPDIMAIAINYMIGYPPGVKESEFGANPIHVYLKDPQGRDTCLKDLGNPFGVWAFPPDQEQRLPTQQEAEIWTDFVETLSEDTPFLAEDPSVRELAERSHLLQ